MRYMEKLTTINQRTYGRYFGICTSFHHSKGCLCPKCPSCTIDGMMFCARKVQNRYNTSKVGCLCTECYNYKQFRLKGHYFCII